MYSLISRKLTLTLTATLGLYGLYKLNQASRRLNPDYYMRPYNQIIMNGFGFVAECEGQEMPYLGASIRALGEGA